MGEGLPQFNIPTLLKPALSPALASWLPPQRPECFFSPVYVPRVLSICMYVNMFSHKNPNINHDTGTEDLTQAVLPLLHLMQSLRKSP